jgi:hypothetical protein
MMTKPERSTIFAGVPGGRCHVGAKSEDPCPRQATEYRWPESEEPTVCAEHMRVLEFADKADDLRDALDQLRRWIQSLPSEDTALIDALYDQRDDLERRYFEVVTKWRGARLIADGRKLRGGREYPEVSPEQAEEAGLALMRGDAFNDARSILEGLPDEAFVSADRFVLCGFLQAAHKAAGAEYERISREVWPSGE